MDEHHQYKIKVEYFVSLVVLLVGVFFVFQAMTIETSRETVGPRTMPLILAISMIIAGAYLGVRAYLGRAGDLKEGYGFLESNVPRILEVIGCGILFIFVFWGFGYFAALIVGFLATMFAFGVRNWVAMLGGALVMAFIFQWLFMGIMLLSDPSGYFVDLRPYTNWIKGE